MENSRFHDLTLKYLAKTATEEELHELEIYLLEYPQQRQVFAALKELQPGLKTPEDEWTAQNSRAAYKRLWKNIEENEPAHAVFTDKKMVRSVRPVLRWAVAASFMLMAGLYVVYHPARFPSITKQPSLPAIKKISVPNGKTQIVVLPDGSTVKLNAGTTLFYPAKFAAENRRVELSGEGFFEVKKDPQKPFLVNTGNITVKVLGTVFNVKAYKGEKNTETTLLSGKVQVQLNREPEKKILLSPNEKLIVMNPPPAEPVKKQAGQKMKYQVMQLPVSPSPKETAWLNHKLIFTNETFEDVARQMERKYAVSIRFDDSTLKSEQISGVFENESLEQALQILEMATPFSYTRNEQIIHLSGKKEYLNK